MKDYKDYTIQYSQNSVRIVNSYTMNSYIDQIHNIKIIKRSSMCPECIKGRTYWSLLAELRAHNVLYFLNIRISQTESCDFDDEPWYRMLGYHILSPFDIIVRIAELLHLVKY